MKEIDWRDIDERHLKAFRQRVALVETLLDECIDDGERKEVRRRYLEEHGVSDRTIRNYLRRYREHGHEGLLFYKPRKSSSPRLHELRLQEKILKLIEQRPSRTVPQLRRLLSADPTFKAAVAKVSNRSIYRFLAESGLTQQARRAKLTYSGRTSYHKFEASCSMELVQGDARDGIWLPRGPGERQVRKSYLFACVDDYSRRILHAEYFWDEKLMRMEKTFKTMVLRWGISKKLYLDNGHVYIASHFAIILADLKIKKIHHGPYKNRGGNEDDQTGFSGRGTAGWIQNPGEAEQCSVGMARCGKKVEALGVKKPVKPAVERIPEERQAAERTVSAETANYFAFPLDKNSRSLTDRYPLLITGPIGCGKSLILRYALEHLDSNLYLLNLYARQHRKLPQTCGCA